MKELILARVGDLVSELVYYDRKDDEEVSVEQIEQAFRDKVVTVDEVVEKFRKNLTEWSQDNDKSSSH